MNARPDPNDFAVYRYDTVFISDLHLGSGKTAAPYLYEFLSHLDLDALRHLYLVGDIFGGWEHQSLRQKPLPEMEKRILDILNYAADRHVKIHVLPGNHDEKLRPLLAALSGRKNKTLFPQNVTFSNETYYSFGNGQKKRLKIVHGDQHDPELFVRPWFRPVTFLTSAFYDGLIALDYQVSNVLYKTFGLHAAFAKPVKSAFKSAIGYFFSHRSLLQGLKEGDFEGILMGHTHMPGIQEFDVDGRKSYLVNCGDWVESATAAVVGESGGMPEILHYKTDRERRGFGALPEPSDPHPACFAAYRPRTDRQVRLMHKLWPARNRAKYFRQYIHARLKLREYRSDRGCLDTIIDTLDRSRRLTPETVDALNHIVLKAKSEVYKAQRRGLKEIFGRYAQDQKLSADDLLYMKTVVREFRTRSDRKIRKHAHELQKAACALDYNPSQPVFAPRALTTHPA